MSKGERGVDGVVGAAERDVGRYVYRRIEALMDAAPGTSEGAELCYLATIAGNVEEYGATACGAEPLSEFPPPIGRPSREDLALAVSRGDDTDVGEWDDCLIMADHLIKTFYSPAQNPKVGDVVAALKIGLLHVEASIESREFEFGRDPALDGLLRAWKADRDIIREALAALRLDQE